MYTQPQHARPQDGAFPNSGQLRLAAADPTRLLLVERAIAGPAPLRVPPLPQVAPRGSRLRVSLAGCTAADMLFVGLTAGMAAAMWFSRG